MRGARGVLINITGGTDITLFEIDAAANRIREEVDPEANIIFGSTFDESLQGALRVSVVATGIETPAERAKMAAAENAQATEAPAQAGGWFPQATYRPQPYPAVQKPAQRAHEANPTLHLRAATEARREPAPATESQYPSFVPPPAQGTPYRAEQPADGYDAVARRVGPRPEDRSIGRGIFERVKGIAFPRGFTGHGPDLGSGQQPSAHPSSQSQFRRESVLASARGPAEPAYDAPAAAESQAPGHAQGHVERGRNGTPSQDELGDIPAFLRKERVDG